MRNFNGRGKVSSCLCFSPSNVFFISVVFPLYERLLLVFDNEVELWSMEGVFFVSEPEK